MGKLAEQQHVARNWVESNFPEAQGGIKAALILAYGAGLDRGFAEVQELIAEQAGALRASHG